MVSKPISLTNGFPLICYSKQNTSSDSQSASYKITSTAYRFSGALVAPLNRDIFYVDSARRDFSFET